MTVAQLLSDGVDLKRKGDFQGARRKYLAALKLEGGNGDVRYALGKTAYLLGFREEAIANYLTICHIELQIQKSRIAGGDFLTSQLFNRLKSENEGIYILATRRHPNAQYILLQNWNLVTHLGHAVVDLDPTYQCNFRDPRYIQVYHHALSGNAAYERDLQGMETLYFGEGFDFILDHLKWEHLDQKSPHLLYCRDETSDFGKSALMAVPRWIRNLLGK